MQIYLISNIPENTSLIQTNRVEVKKKIIKVETVEFRLIRSQGKGYDTIYLFQLEKKFHYKKEFQMKKKGVLKNPFKFTTMVIVV